jgi:hypothetical protein
MTRERNDPPKSVSADEETACCHDQLSKAWTARSNVRRGRCLDTVNVGCEHAGKYARENKKHVEDVRWKNLT